jgi:hypothetical protein
MSINFAGSLERFPAVLASKKLLIAMSFHVVGEL